jgi:hypothetical protein
MITSSQIHDILHNIVKPRRRLFHSEADFQHELAWGLRERFSDYDFRFERPWDGLNRRIYVDLWVEDPAGGVTVIELKYKTAALTVREYAEEAFDLKDQRAQDVGRYDFIKDIWRLEQMSEQIDQFAGFALIMTNDPKYWSEYSGTYHDDFQLPGGRRLEGRLAWSEKAAEGSLSGRARVLELNGRYRVEWSGYSELCHGLNCQLDYCLIEVG